jgi:hypothetical protein
MAYFIFLKSLRSLGEFRKNPHVKIPLKSPCANFQSHCIFKNSKFYSEIILLSFRPIQPIGPAAAHSFFSNRLIFPPLPTGPRPPGRPNRPPVIFFLPHQSQARCHRRPSSRCLHGRPDASTGREKWPHLIPLHFPPLISAIPPSLIPETGAFNPAIEAPSSRQLKALGPPLPRLRPIKADQALGGASHTSNAPSPSPHRTLVIARLSRSLEVCRSARRYNEYSAI